MNNKEIGKAFVRGARTGKGSNMFINGDAIYSYGYHFMISRRTSRGILVTASEYSRSTARHVQYVKQALGWNYILAADCTNGRKGELNFPKLAEIRARKVAAAKGTAHRAHLDALAAKRDERKAAARAVADAETARTAPPAWVVAPVAGGALE